MDGSRFSVTLRPRHSDQQAVLPRYNISFGRFELHSDAKNPEKPDDASSKSKSKGKGKADNPLKAKKYSSHTSYFLPSTTSINFAEHLKKTKAVQEQKGQTCKQQEHKSKLDLAKVQVQLKKAFPQRKIKTGEQLLINMLMKYSVHKPSGAENGLKELADRREYSQVLRPALKSKTRLVWMKQRYGSTRMSKPQDSNISDIVFGE